MCSGTIMSFETTCADVCTSPCPSDVDVLWPRCGCGCPSDVDVPAMWMWMSQRCGFPSDVDVDVPAMWISLRRLPQHSPLSRGERRANRNRVDPVSDPGMEPTEVGRITSDNDSILGVEEVPGAQGEGQEVVGWSAPTPVVQGHHPDFQSLAVPFFSPPPRRRWGAGRCCSRRAAAVRTVRWS